jgi:hypothetical protein
MVLFLFWVMLNKLNEKETDKNENMHSYLMC